jgi:hypothetical protein
VSTHVQPDLSSDPALLESLRRQVVRVVYSEAFRGSETLRKLLEYLTDRALENTSNCIKAKEIAAAAASPHPGLWGGAKQRYRKELGEVARSEQVRMAIWAAWRRC